MEPAPTREEIERLAYQLWLERRGQAGSPEQDWERAERLLNFSPGAASPDAKDPPSTIDEIEKSKQMDRKSRVRSPRPTRGGNGPGKPAS